MGTSDLFAKLKEILKGVNQTENHIDYVQQRSAAVGIIEELLNLCLTITAVKLHSWIFGEFFLIKKKKTLFVKVVQQ